MSKDEQIKTSKAILDEIHDENKVESNPGGILAKLLRKILKESGYSRQKISQLVLRYVEEENHYQNQFSKRKAKINSSQVLKNMGNRSLTWKQFIRTLFSILKVRRIVFKVEIEHEDRRITQHQHSVILNMERTPVAEDIDKKN